MSRAEPLRVRLTPRAEQDLEDIWQYTAQTWSPAQADRYVAALSVTLDTLSLLPEIARERTEFSPPVRIHPSGRHVIIYRVDADHLDIIRILGGKQDWLAMLNAL
jgi:toxin ParE1/3/4